jgi:protein gp37
MGDLFHGSVPDEWIDQVFAIMAMAPQHTFQILTKRPERMKEYCDGNPVSIIHKIPITVSLKFPFGFESKYLNYPLNWPLPNVWLGVSAENQPTADDRIPILLNTPAAKRFVSLEPLLGPIVLTDRDPIRLATGKDALPENRVYVSLLKGWGLGQYALPGLDWVITGGESGPNARPVHPEWVRSLRDQCLSAKVPFFFKQWGEWHPMGEKMADGNTNCMDKGENPLKFREDGLMVKVGKAHAGRTIDGCIWDEIPGDIMP